MSKLIYKSKKPYAEDLNDLIEDQELEKGRGPDKQKRKSRSSGESDLSDQIRHHDYLARQANLQGRSQTAKMHAEHAASLRSKKQSPKKD